MEHKDYYKILEVNQKATPEEIKKSFRKLAIKWHPDKNKDSKAAEEQFKRITEANEVLSDPEKRKKYDELGDNWQQFDQAAGAGAQQQRGQNFYSGGAGGGSPFGDSGEEDYSDFFGQFFSGAGSGGGRQQARRGQDYQAEMEITLEEAYRGIERILQLPDEKLRITTKPGVADEQRLRIKGKGAKGATPEQHGDLFVRIHVQPDGRYERRGDDLHSTHTIDLYTAVLGGDAVVATLTGQIKVKIAAGTQNAKSIRIKGKGMPLYGQAGQYGDLYVTLRVAIPETLTPAQRELFEQLRQKAN